MKLCLFQSSPPEFGGRVVPRRRCRTPTAGFNPRPPNSGGASRCPTTRRRPTRGFNPRPPNSGGASCAAIAVRSHPPVSILAPRIRGARQPSFGKLAVAALFQSSPPEFGGRVVCCPLFRHRLHCFNPRPPNSGGASEGADDVRPSFVVSILAPRIRGARRHRSCRCRLRSRCFNPRPPNSGGAS